MIKGLARKPDSPTSQRRALIRVFHVVETSAWTARRRSRMESRRGSSMRRSMEETRDMADLSESDALVEDLNYTLKMCKSTQASRIWDMVS